MANNLSKEELFEALDEYFRSKVYHEHKEVICPFSQEDVYFIKRFKSTFDRATYAVGITILLGLIGTIGLVFKLGLESWRSGGN